MNVLCLNVKDNRKEEEFKDTKIKGVMRIHKSKKDRQHNGQKKMTDNTMVKRKSTKQRSTKHTHKTKDRVTVKTKLYCIL